MGLKDTLETHSQRRGKHPRCRICVLLETLPPEESAALEEFFSPTRNVGPKPIADALAAEGHGSLYHSVKGHMYVCRTQS